VAEAAAPAAGDATLLAFADAAGVPRRWRLLSGGAVIGRGDELAQLPEQRPWVRTMLAVPGTDVTLHWVELTEGLTAVQAAAAARLRLAEELPDAIGELHLAAGRRENGLTAIAVTPAARMQAWLAGAAELGMEPDVILPSPMLLLPPGEGLVCYRGDEGPADYRGTARAFSLEDELAELVLGDFRVTEIGEDLREAGLGPALADPAVNLRQGAFARRREFVIDPVRVRWLVTLGLLLLTVSLMIQIVAIIRTTWAADHYEAEAKEVRRALGAPGTQARPAGASYGVAAAALFDAIRETPSAELSQIVYQPDGSLRASLLADSQATIDALRARVEARGMQAAGGVPTNLGGRAAGDITIRPR
jgi:general secretion pathway protein L